MKTDFTNTASSRRRQRGIAALEMAVALPVLLLLMLGVTEIGQILFQYNTLTKSGRDAARYLAAEATLGSTDVIQIDAQLEARTRNLAVHGNASGTGPPVLEGLAVDDVTVTAVDALHVSVALEHTYNPLFGTVLPSMGFGDGTLMAIDLRSTVIMRAL